MRYENMADNTVLDHQTGLIWQRSVAENLTHSQAQAYAERVARETGLRWRVPTVDELVNLVDCLRCDPASGFPDMPSERFWSSSPYVGDADSAWLVDFRDGEVYYNYRSRSRSVRLVRSN